MVGDSLTSDIQGGINAGLRTVWINPKQEKAQGIAPDFEIPDITRLEELLDRL